ncbi:MAG: hypothetical protein COA73_06225 [Candidatus Hydrogenedentota bacterium]|nr:MAG: hypothetical protein COA73_06225 [Candidatus Hydrogenedentota bacterium]
MSAAEGHHDFPLEDLGLEVGDFITWTIWARDNKPDRDEYEVLGDPYFLEIRPFKKRFSEAISGAGGQGDEQEDDLAQTQKEILIATWNLRRESRYMDNDEFEEKRDIVVDTQEKLLKQVNDAGGMTGGDVPPEIPKLKEAMQRSVDALTRSALPDPKTELSEATAHQQVANRLIARLKPLDTQVQQSQGGGGGGAGERPDIGDLEMARNRNFYEEENVTQAQQEAVDEAMNRIKELAQRQQSVNEELAKLISELKNAKTEEEKERIQRKLERLEEEIKKNLERLDDARRKLSSENMDREQSRDTRESLDDARHQMNRTLELMERNELQKARSVSARAVDALEDIQEQLRQFSRGAAAQRMKELVDRMDDLAKKQHDIMDKTEESLEKHQAPTLDDPDSAETIKQDILAQKESLEEEFVELMNEASELAERGKDSQELMARNLGDWLRETSREGILEDMQESLPLIKYDIWETAALQEMGITEKMDEALQKLAAVQDSLVEDELSGMQKALGHLDTLMDSDEMRELAQAMGGSENEEGQQSGEQGDGEQQGGQPDPNGEQQGLSPDENGELQRMAQQQSGGQAGEQGQQPSELQGEESGQSGSGQQPGQEPGQQQGEESGQQQGQQSGGQPNPTGSPSQSNSSNGGSGNPNNLDRGDMMRQFASGGYRQWLQELRDAEALLPENSPVREQIRDVREEVEAIRRDWKARALAPRFDLFLKVAGQPLVEAADRLQREIEKKMDEKEFVLTDEGEVPERYKERVAEYFKGLSEAEQLQ